MFKTMSITAWLEALELHPMTGYHLDNARFTQVQNIFMDPPCMWHVAVFDNDPLKAMIISTDPQDKAMLNVPYLDPQESKEYVGSFIVSMVIFGQLPFMINLTEREQNIFAKLFYFARDMLFAQESEVEEDMQKVIAYRDQHFPLIDADVSIAFRITD